MRPAALLHHRDRLPDLPLRLEVAQQDHGIGEIAGVDGRDHRPADQPVVRADQDRGHPRLPEIRQQLVELDDQEPLLGHGVEIAVQAVDDHHRRALTLDGAADGVRELARRQLGRVHLLDRHRACVPMLPQVDTQTGTAGQQGVDALVENEQGSLLPLLGRRHHKLRGQRRLSGSGRADDQGAGAVLEAPAEQGVQLGDAAGQLFCDRRQAMLARDEPRKDVDSPAPDGVVVKAAAEAHAAVLDDQEPPPLGAVLRVQLLQPHHAVRDALDLQVVGGAGQIVQQQHRAAPAGEELLEGEDLPAVAQRVAGQEAQLRERIERHARRLDPLDVRQDRLRRLAQLDFRRMEHRVLVVRPQALFRGHQLADCDAVQRPAVGGCHLAQLLLGLRQSHVEDRLAEPDALHQELHRQRRLPRAGNAFDQVQPIRGEPSPQDVVETFDAGRGAGWGRACGRRGVGGHGRRSYRRCGGGAGASAARRASIRSLSIAYGGKPLTISRTSTLSPPGTRRPSRNAGVP